MLKQTLIAAAALTAVSAASLPFAAVAWAGQAQVQSAETSEEQSVRRTLDAWFRAWSPGQAPFDVEALRPLFAEGEILVFDNFADGVITLTSFDDYAATWGPIMRETFASWRIRPATEPKVTVSGDLATATFMWEGGGTTHAGEAVTMSQAATHILRKFDGVWRIVHEHLTVAE